MPNPLDQLISLIRREGSQKAVAETLVGISQRYLSDVVLEKSGFSASLAHKLEESYGLDARKIMRFQADQDWKRFRERERSHARKRT